MRKLEELSFDEYIQLTLNGMLWERYPEATGYPLKDIKTESIKKYIPDDYELDISKEPNVDIDIDQTGILSFYIKKKEKCFNEYVINFIKRCEISDTTINLNNTPLNIEYSDSYILYGILKDICDDYNITIEDVYQKNKTITSVKKVLDMLPDGFIKKIFK